MAIIVATAAATVNILMAFYNVAKDAIGLSKRKIRYANNLETYKESLQWKKESLQRTRAGASRKVEKFGTETVRLHNHWGERVDKTDAELGNFLEKCEKAESFRKRAQLGEKGSVLAKEVEKVEADGKLFYDPSYRTRHKTSKSVHSFVWAGDTISNSSIYSSNSWNSRSSSNNSNSSDSSYSRISSRSSYMAASRNTGSSTRSGPISSSKGRSELKSRSCNYSNRSTVAVKGSPTWSTVAVTGSRGWRRVGGSARYN